MDMKFIFKGVANYERFKGFKKIAESGQLSKELMDNEEFKEEVRKCLKKKPEKKLLMIIFPRLLKV